MGHWGTCPSWSLRIHASFAAVHTMAVLILLPSSVSSKLDRQSHQLLWQAVAKDFSHIRFCRPNSRWLSLLDDFVTANFGTRAPRACAPPRRPHCAGCLRNIIFPLREVGSQMQDRCLIQAGGLTAFVPVHAGSLTEAGI